MHAIGVGQIGQAQVVVDDQRRAVAAAQRGKLACLLVAARDIGGFVAVLHGRRAAGERGGDLLQQPRGVGCLDGDRVQAAGKQGGRAHALPSVWTSCAQKKRSGMYCPMPGRKAAFSDS